MLRYFAVSVLFVISLSCHLFSATESSILQINSTLNVTTLGVWESYDDFSSGTMNWLKWTQDPDTGEMADIADGQMRLAVTQQAGKESTDTEARINVSVSGVKADVQLLNTTTAKDGGVKLMVSLNGGAYEAEYGIWRDEYAPTSTYLIGGVFNNSTEEDYYTIFYPGTFASNTTYNLVILVSSDAIYFYVNDELVETYTNQNGVLTPPYSVDWIGFESRTYNVGDFVDGRVDNVYVPAGELPPYSYDAVSDHLEFLEVDFGCNYLTPDTTTPEYEFSASANTDDAVDYIEISTPTGNTVTILPEKSWDETNQIYSERYYDDKEGNYHWEYSHEFPELATFTNNYGDGDYTFTIYYVDESTASTTVWFGVPGTASAIPLPTQKPVITSPLYKEGNLTSPVTLSWEAIVDSAAPQMGYWFEKGDDDDGPEPFDVGPTSSDPITLSDGIWTLGIEIGSLYEGADNGDGIPYQISKHRGVNSKIAVGHPWYSYSVWGGNYLDTSSDSWWEYFLYIDQQSEYTFLGASLDGSTETFSGYYDYYAITSTEILSVDSFQGSTGDYYPGYNYTTGQVTDWGNTAGAPDGQYATFGEDDPYSTFIGFMVIDNPGSWEGLTVITDQEESLPDYNSDNYVDVSDLAIFANYWLEGNCTNWNWCDGADFNKDGTVSLKDMVALSEGWLYNESLVGHWLLDEGSGNIAYDKAGDNDGTIAGSASYQTGVIGQCLDFNGTTDYVMINNSSSFDTEALTISAWIYPTSASQGTIVSKNVPFAIMHSPDGNIQFGIYAGTTPGWDWVTGSVTVKLNTWTHIVCTYDTTSMTIYVNGALDTTKTHSIGGSLFTDVSNLYIGYGTPGLNQFFAGSIDDVRVYNMAISQATASQIYKSTKSDFVGYWTFDEGSGNVAYDESCNRNNGTISGSASYLTGVYDNCLSFNGTTDYVMINNSVSLETDSITISAWIYPTSASQGTIVSKNVPFAVMHSPSGNIQFGIFAGTSPGWDWATGSIAVSLNTWTHIACTYDKTSMKIYIDGVLDTAKTHSIGGNIFAYESNLYIGYGTPGLDQYFAGNIDDVRIYNHSLSESEIAELH